MLQLGMGFWASKPLLRAVELELFTELAKKPKDLETLTRLHRRHPRDVQPSALSILGAPHRGSPRRRHSCLRRPGITRSPTPPLRCRAGFAWVGQYPSISKNTPFHSSRVTNDPKPYKRSHQNLFRSFICSDDDCLLLRPREAQYPTRLRGRSRLRRPRLLRIGIHSHASY